MYEQSPHLQLRKAAEADPLRLSKGQQAALHTPSTPTHTIPYLHPGEEAVARAVPPRLHEGHAAVAVQAGDDLLQVVLWRLEIRIEDRHISV